jgi:hypothetical protein
MPPSRFPFPLALFLSTLAVTEEPCLHDSPDCLASTPGAHLLGVLFTLEASYFAGRFVSRGPRLWDFFANHSVILLTQLQPCLLRPSRSIPALALCLLTADT